MSWQACAPAPGDDRSKLLSEIREYLRLICAALDSPNATELVGQLLDFQHFYPTAQRAPDREWYTVSELADKVNRKKYTVQTWCWRGRINAVKARHGRGIDKEWRISHEEYLRYRKDGLLPGRPRD
jgi:hypothetical protein